MTAGGQPGCDIVTTLPAAGSDLRAATEEYGRYRHAHRLATGQALIACAADPGSPSRQALTFLASWATSSEVATAPDGTSEDHPA